MGTIFFILMLTKLGVGTDHSGRSPEPNPLSGGVSQQHPDSEVARCLHGSVWPWEPLQHLARWTLIRSV